ncbi:MAG: 5,6-dimethylbenzimidazole synthase [Hyphomicrobiaceae bacterium]
MDATIGSPQCFDAAFRAGLERLLAWRRDVRSFLARDIEPEALAAILASLETAPSVGLSQPWTVIRVRSADARARVVANFEAANATAARLYEGTRHALYLDLKLEGLRTAPEHLAVFYDTDPAQGNGLGRQTMPEMLLASAACAIMQMWIVARAWGVGLGWVSILDAERLATDLAAPPAHRLAGYLCLGYPAAPSETPELEQTGWERRVAQLARIETR